MYVAKDYVSIISMTAESTHRIDLLGPGQTYVKVYKGASDRRPSSMMKNPSKTNTRGSMVRVAEPVCIIICPFVLYLIL